MRLINLNLVQVIRILTTNTFKLFRQTQNYRLIRYNVHATLQNINEIDSESN